jgi:hypothetical protein
MKFLVKNPHMITDTVRYLGTYRTGYVIVRIWVFKLNKLLFVFSSIQFFVCYIFSCWNADVETYIFLRIYFEVSVVSKRHASKISAEKGGKNVTVFALRCIFAQWDHRFWSIIFAQCPKFPHFGAQFCGKDCGLCPYNPSAEEVGGLDGFLYEAAQNFEVFSNSQDYN